MTIIFITGAEGVGKTTLINYLKKTFLQKDIHDFDEFGVPENPSLSWRCNTTRYWLKIAKKNEKFEKDTLIIGLSFPSEIQEFSKRKDIYFCLLEVNQKERVRRLRKRNATKELIDDVDQLKQLRKEFKRLKKKKVINTSNFNPKEISFRLIKWVNDLK